VALAPSIKTAIKATLVAAAIGGGVVLVTQVGEEPTEPTGLEPVMVTLPMLGAEDEG